MRVLAGTSLCSYCKNANEQHSGAKTTEGGQSLLIWWPRVWTPDKWQDAAYVWTLPVWCAYMLMAGGWGALFPSRFFLETPQSLVNAREWGACLSPPSRSLWSAESEVSELEPEMALANSPVPGWEPQFWDWQCGWRVSVQHGRSRVIGPIAGDDDLYSVYCYTALLCGLTNLPPFPTTRFVSSYPPPCPPFLPSSTPEQEKVMHVNSVGEN